LANINNPASQADCPTAWKFADASGTGVCVPPRGPGCFSVNYTPGVPYRFVRGNVAGIQFGQVCGFGPNTRTHLLNGTSNLKLARWCWNAIRVHPLARAVGTGEGRGE
jgi:hypothetical protein